VQNNLTVNNHYLLCLFRKVVGSFNQQSNLEIKKLVFGRLKRATIESIREVLQSRSILLTMRKRVVLHGLVRVYRYRKRVKRALQVSTRYGDLTLKRKYFGELKINTLL